MQERDPITEVEVDTVVVDTEEAVDLDTLESKQRRLVHAWQSTAWNDGAQPGKN